MQLNRKLQMTTVQNDARWGKWSAHPDSSALFLADVRVGPEQSSDMALTHNPLTHTKTDPWPIIHTSLFRHYLVRWPIGLTT